MTDDVAENNRRARYLVTDEGGQDTFDIPFPLEDVDYIRVYVNGIAVSAEDYTVSLTALTVVLDTAADKDDIVVLEGLRTIERPNKYPLSGGLSSGALNSEFRSVFYMLQEMRRDIERALILNPSEADSVSGVLDTMLPGYTLMVKTDGSGITNGFNAAQLSDVSDNIDDVITVADLENEITVLSGLSTELESIYAIRADILAVPAQVAQTAADVITTASNVTAAQTARTGAEMAQAAAEAAASGMKWRPPVKAATTANVTLSGEQTIDGVSVTAGSRVLVKNQSPASQNGVYVCAAGAWSRASDADTWNELVGQVVIVSEGSTYADNIYICTVDEGGTLDTTDITWDVLPILPASIGNSKLANMTQATIKGRESGAGTGAPQDLTPAQLRTIIDVYTQAQVDAAISTAIAAIPSGWELVASDSGTTTGSGQTIFSDANFMEAGYDYEMVLNQSVSTNLIGIQFSNDGSTFLSGAFYDRYSLRITSGAISGGGNDLDKTTGTTQSVNNVTMRWSVPNGLNSDYLGFKFEATEGNIDYIGSVKYITGSLDNSNFTGMKIQSGGALNWQYAIHRRKRSA